MSSGFMAAGADLVSIDLTQIATFIRSHLDAAESTALLKAFDESGWVDEDLSYSLANILRANGRLQASLEVPVEDTKLYSMFKRKWYKIAFEKQNAVIEQADSKRVGGVLTTGPEIMGWVPRATLQTLTKVDELYEYVLAREEEIRERVRSGYPAKNEPKLILDSFGTTAAPDSKPGSSLILGDTTAPNPGRLLSASGEELPMNEKKKRLPKPKLNEIQKEEGEFDQEFRTFEFLAPELVRGVALAKASGHDLVILTRWMEILGTDKD